MAGAVLFEQSFSRCAHFPEIVVCGSIQSLRYVHSLANLPHVLGAFDWLDFARHFQNCILY